MKSVFLFVVAILMTIPLNAQDTCPVCHGRGVSAAKIYPPTYGRGRDIMQGNCRYCDDIYIHSHKTCPYCKGTGSGQNSTPRHDYSNVFNNENVDYNAYVYCGIALASVVIFSDEIYMYPVVSAYRHAEGDQITEDGFGWAFGFRHTFAFSALEYGASCLKSKTNYSYGYPEESERWGAHLNFVHQIFYYKTPDWLKLYIGPSINYVCDFGYGGIIGAEARLLDRLKFDIRYERTTQTNQFQAG
jgi:RNA polymerase subunit RPABC4/transcription elongation factor Spt4